MKLRGGCRFESCRGQLENSGDNLIVHGKVDTRLLMKPFRVAVAKCLEVIGLDCTFENFERFDEDSKANWFRWLGEIDRAAALGPVLADKPPGVYMIGWDGTVHEMGKVIAERTNE